MALPATLPALRDDIAIFAAGASPSGTPSWRLHDPLRNRFFQIGEAEFEMLARWHLGTPAALLDDIGGAMPLAPDAENLEALLQFLHQHQLLARRDRQATAALARLAAPAQAWTSWLLHHYLFVRIPLANPDRFYSWLAPRLGWLFTRRFWLGAGALGLAGLVQVMLQQDRFSRTFSYAFSLEGALWIALALMLLKTTHEIGHGVAAKRHGLRVTRTGVALLVLWPVLYTDVNDIWKLSDWRARLQISAAGIATELLCAVAATWAWLLLPEGPLQSAMFVIAGTAWILSLAINLNPFMRFDGYYLLSDLLDYPNLQDDAFRAARAQLRRRIGLDEPPAPAGGLPRAALAAFGYGTWLYRGLLFAGIAWFLLLTLPLPLGAPLAAIEVAWFIVRPVMGELRVWWPRRAEIGPRRRRAYAAAAALVLVAALLPWSGSVTAPAYLSVAGRENLFVPASAQVRAIHVRNGQQVAQGQVLLELAAPELAQRLASLEARILEARARLDKAASSSQTLDQAGVLQQTLAERMVERDSVRAEIARLTVRASRAGVLRDLAPHIVAGRWLRRDERLATLLPAGAAARLQVLGYVAEADYQRVRAGAPVRFYPDGDPLTVLHGSVRTLDVASSTRVAERALASVGGGPLPSSAGAGGERLHGAFYAVTADIAATPGAAIGRSGSLQIDSARHHGLADQLRAAMGKINAMLGW